MSVYLTDWECITKERATGSFTLFHAYLSYTMLLNALSASFKVTSVAPENFRERFKFYRLFFFVGFIVSSSHNAPLSFSHMWILIIIVFSLSFSLFAWRTCLCLNNQLNWKIKWWHKISFLHLSQSYTEYHTQRASERVR